MAREDDVAANGGGRHAATPFRTVTAPGADAPALGVGHRSLEPHDRAEDARRSATSTLRRSPLSGRPVEREVRDSREEAAPADAGVSPFEEERRLGDDLDERERREEPARIRPPSVPGDETRGRAPPPARASRPFARRSGTGRRGEGPP